MRWWPWALLLLAYPTAVCGVWLGSGPAVAGHWQIEGDVVRVEHVPKAGRLEPLPVAHVDVMQVRADGEGRRPEGTIEVAMPDWVPGAEDVRQGRRMQLAVSPAGDDFHLEDARHGCCWASRVDQAQRMWPVFPAAALCVPMAYWASRHPLRPWWSLAAAAAGGAAAAVLAADWSTEPMRLIIGDGEENYAIGAGALLLVGVAAAAWAAHVAGGRPAGWAALLAWVLVYPMGVAAGTPDADLAVVVIPLPLLAVVVGQRRWVWAARAAGIVLLAATALMAWQASQAPHGSDPLASVVLAVVFAGVAVPLVLDGLLAWRPEASRSRPGPAARVP